MEQASGERGIEDGAGGGRREGALWGIVFDARCQFGCWLRAPEEKDDCRPRESC